MPLRPLVSLSVIFGGKRIKVTNNEGVLPPQITPVVGRLSDFVEGWKRITNDPYVLSIVAKGYRLRFTSPPLLRQTSLEIRSPQGQEEILGMREHISLMLQKNAITEVPPDSPGFYSNVFLVRKASGGWRPVIDLKNLNSHIHAPHFRMFTTNSVLSSVRKGDYAFKIDLQDAYFHVPIHPSSRKFLRFAFENKVYQFRVLPFGLNTAPQVFTRLGHTVTGYLHRQGISVIPYLDGWLVHHPNRQVLLRHQAQLLDTLDLYPGVGRPHGEFPDFGYLDPYRPQAPYQLSGAQGGNFCPTALGPSAPGPPGYDRYRQFDSSFVYQQTRRDPVPHLVAFEDPLFLTSGIPIRTFQADFTIFTDASTQGWGAHMGNSQISGIWTRTDRRLHINCLELKAVISALQHWAPVLQGHHFMIATDNSTVVSYINKQGGTLSPTLLRLTVELLLWLEAQNIIVRARHIPGCLNVIADHLVVPSARDREMNLQGLGDTRSRHVCNCFELPPSSVHVSNSVAKSPRGGCSVSGLGGEVNIHVPSIPSTQQSNSETQVHSGGRGDSHSPLVAESVVVSTPTSSLCGTPPVLSPPLRSSVPAGSEVCLRRIVVPSARMEALMRHYKAAGFSDEVSRLAAAPRRPSTNRMYDDRWLRFAQWAAGQGFDPLDPTAAQIASF